MQELHISMLGAQGTGKSSLLASMYYTFKKNAGELGFLMKPASADDSNQLNDRHFEMLAHLQGVYGEEEGIPPGEEDHEYTLLLGFQKDSVQDYWLSLHFWDFPGGWINDNRERVIEHLNKSQVILIAIDTPSLVVDDTHGNYQLWHSKKNQPNIITDIFSEIALNEAKLVLFVPIKCEAWRQKNNGSQLIADQVRKGYDGLITLLKKHPKITLATTPVQTLGNYIWTGRTKKRDNKKEVLKDRFYPINSGVNGRSQFEPREIDQPLIYMLSFLSQQVRTFLTDNATHLEAGENEIKTTTTRIQSDIQHSIEARRGRNIFQMLIDWIHDNTEEKWREGIEELEEKHQQLEREFKKLDAEKQQLFSKLAQLQIPLSQLNHKRIEDKSRGFEVIQGKNQLLSE